MKIIIKIFFAALACSVIAFLSISFISFMLETLTITKSWRESDNELHIGFPYQIFEQFYVNDCNSPNRGWFILNIIKNFSLIFLVSLIFFTIYYRGDNKRIGLSI